MRFIGKLIKYTLIFNVMALISGVIVKQLVQSEGDESTDEFTLATVMFGNHFASKAEALRKGSLVTFMGGVELDLTAATLSPGATLDLLTIMGGVDVRVPPHWRVEVTDDVIAGDSQVTLDGQNDLPAEAPVLKVTARTIMGGLGITNQPKRTTSPTPWGGSSPGPGRSPCGTIRDRRGWKTARTRSASSSAESKSFAPRDRNAF